FISSVDQLYGPITVKRQEGRINKKIPWSAFVLLDSDWRRIRDAKDILEDSRKVQHLFSSEHQPTAIEQLQTAWEKKLDNKHFEPYHEAITNGLEKLRKYYNMIDAKPAYIIALAIHPYFKLDYFEHHWGGEKEQQEEIRNGNFYAKNWQDEAHKVLERTASHDTII
ncbi:hypothetical protein JOM56_014517, partial [Amanita muscaria]